MEPPVADAEFPPLNISCPPSPLVPEPTEITIAPPRPPLP